MSVQAAPYILFGLLFAGLIHVLLPESLVLRWMGSPGLWGVIRAALIGVPLPVCSCGVVPITVELRRKGASGPASQSFLITTPESSIDSIFLTWGMMGPVMAVARPVAAFFTAVIGGILSIASARNLNELTAGFRPTGPVECTHPHHDHDHDDHHHHGHDHDHDGHDHDHDGHDHHHHHAHDHHHHGHHHEHKVAFSGGQKARLALLRAFGFGPKPEVTEQTESDLEAPDQEIDEAGVEAAIASETKVEPDTGLWRDLFKPCLRYGFGELLDDLAFWLVVGIGLAGFLTTLLPDNLEELGLGSGLLPMVGLLIVGIPLYMCASASTPIAAALLLKGFSPGAALVFLLAGPATNAATVILLAATFGRRFVQIYIVSVAAGALASGLLLDSILQGFDVTHSLQLSAEAPPGWISILSALLLVALLIRSLTRGAWAVGVAELRDAGRRMSAALPQIGPTGRRRVWTAALLIPVLAYLATGFAVVPTGYQGYGFVFGALTHADMPPGLHYLPPAPFGDLHIRHVEYPRKTDVGFRTDLRLIERRRELIGGAPPDEWHSPVAAMNKIPSQAAYLTGDGHLVELSFSVHYALNDPQTFLYGVGHGQDFVNLYAEAEARELIAGLLLEDLLTERRSETQKRLLDALQETLDAQDLGIRVVAVRLVDLHPPGAAVEAFRDVSSAKEDRETAIHQARAELARRIPLARGQAAERVAEAEAGASRQRQEALGSSRSFISRAEPIGENREVLKHLLWIETMERTLTGRQKVILPSGVDGSDSLGLTLWQDAPPAQPSFLEENP